MAELAQKKERLWANTLVYDSRMHRLSKASAFDFTLLKP